jgi:hypothetical protein
VTEKKKGRRETPLFLEHMHAGNYSAAFAARLGSFSLMRADLPERSRR